MKAIIHLPTDSSYVSKHLVAIPTSNDILAATIYGKDNTLTNAEKNTLVDTIIVEKTTVPLLSKDNIRLFDINNTALYIQKMNPNKTLLKKLLPDSHFGYNENISSSDIKQFARDMDYSHLLEHCVSNEFVKDHINELLTKPLGTQNVIKFLERIYKNTKATHYMLIRDDDENMNIIRECEYYDILNMVDLVMDSIIKDS